MMKRWIAWVLVLVMVCCAAAAYAGEEDPAVKTRHEIEQKTLTVYVGVIENNFEMPFYFMDGVTDLPWMDMESWCVMMIVLAQAWYGDETYDLMYTIEGETITLTRENGFYMTFDFAANRISCLDYNMFLHDSSNSSALDLLSMKGYNEAGEAELFQRNPTTTFDRLGSFVEIDLSDYGIELVFQDGVGYVPLQTLGDLILTPGFFVNTFFNGKAVFFATADYFGSAAEGYTPLGEYYYSAEPCERSEALAAYGYNELCLALDTLYGLKEIHDIRSFDHLFWQLGYEQYLKSTDAAVADEALASFINCYLDDLHSLFQGGSWMSAEREQVGYWGTMANQYGMHMEEYSDIRSTIMEEVPFYTEVGNTAYITFDSFISSSDGASYYSGAERGDMPEDTIGQIIMAHALINRENSPIENVVIDLSCNGGGSVDAGLFLISWVLGEAPFCVKDTFTGALSTATYLADTNLDRAFDERDVLTGKKVYCLISPLSFSCGNLVPAVFKYSQRVTLLGRTSGGGSCIVRSMSSAWGSVFTISSQHRMSFFKNGSFYDIDQGVDPDIYLANITHFYDREKLTAYINNLF